MAKYTVRLRGRGVDRTTAYNIISRGKKGTSEHKCPYRTYTVKWSIWITAFRYKKAKHGQIYQALLDAKVNCNIKAGKMNWVEGEDNETK